MVFVISIVVVLALIFAFYKIGTELTKPERIIENYITARVNSDYEAIYNTLDVGDEEFLNKNIFLKCSGTDEKAENIKVASINITVATEDDFYKDSDPLSESKVDLAYKVVYTTQTELKPKTEIVYLTKTGKTLLFFDNNAHITSCTFYDSHCCFNVICV